MFVDEVQGVSLSSTNQDERGLLLINRLLAKPTHVNM